ncbi:MAG: hypothetical protein ACK4UN_09890 [Limisphaerales bacterium]
MVSMHSDILSHADAAQNPGNIFITSASSPYKLFVSANGEVHATDYSDTNGNVFRLNPDLTTPNGGAQTLAVLGGPSTLPEGQTHGSITGVHVEGSYATGDLVIYTIDEDLRSAPTPDDRNSLWKYDIGSGLPSAVAP